jgi:ribose transport system substrate-binding protein
MSPSLEDGLNSVSRRYLNESVSRACDILMAFRFEGELLRLRDLVERTGLSKATAFRIVNTLTSRGLVERAGRFQYRSKTRLLQHRNLTLGYAAQTSEFAFSRAVTESIERAAAKEGISLITVNNRYSTNIALRNADLLIREKVALVMEFQIDEHAAPIISGKYREAGIPMIAIEIPHPGAIYYGADNYRAGLMGGRYLGRWAKQHWEGRVDEVILLEVPRAGPLPQSRLAGALQGLKEVLPSAENVGIFRFDCNGQFGRSLNLVRNHLRRTRAQRTLVAAINDPSAIGALRAFEEAGRAQNCAVMGQNASVEARSEMRRLGSRLIGSVGYFPEKYGDGLIPLALEIIHKKHALPAIFVEHKLVTSDNVDQLYPNDPLLEAAAIDEMLFVPSGAKTGELSLPPEQPQ